MSRISLWASLGLLAVVAASVPATTTTSTVHLFPHGLTQTRPSGKWSRFFEVRPGLRATGGSVHLVFSYSPSIKEGSVTLLLNGRAFASKSFPGSVNGPVVLDSALPAADFKAGFNELTISSRQRTSDQPCLDIDNDANWLRFEAQSVLSVSRDGADPLLLAALPFPFVDSLSDQRMQGPFLLPANPTPDQIGSMLDLASLWGEKSQGPLLDPKVALDSPHAPGVLVGGACDGVRFVTPNRLELGASGLPKSIAFLANDNLLSQAGSAIGSSQIPDGAPTSTAHGLKMGVNRLGDIFGGPIQVAGSFQQSSSFTVVRPILCDLGRQSAIHLKFRHAAGIEDFRSELNVSINSTPIGSVRLTPDNANGGEVVIPIPISILAQNRWVVSLNVFHDTGDAGCTKDYSEIAWTTVEPDSTIELTPGLLKGRPFLEQFPYFVGRSGDAAKPVTVILAHPEDKALLNLANVIAARAGRLNGGRVLFTLGTASTKPIGNVIVIGQTSDATNLSAFGAQAPLVVKGGGFQPAQGVHFLPGAEDGGAILEAANQAGDPSGVAYLVFVANDDAAGRLADYLTSDTSLDELGGPLALMRKDGSVVKVAVDATGDIAAEEQRESDRYTPPMMIVMGAIILLAIGFVVWAFKQFVKRTPPTSAH